MKQVRIGVISSCINRSIPKAIKWLIDEGINLVDVFLPSSTLRVAGGEDAWPDTDSRVHAIAVRVREVLDSIAQVHMDCNTNALEIPCLATDFVGLSDEAPFRRVHAVDSLAVSLATAQCLNDFGLKTKAVEILGGKGITVRRHEFKKLNNRNTGECVFEFSCCTDVVGRLAQSVVGGFLLARAAWRKVPGISGTTSFDVGPAFNIGLALEMEPEPSRLLSHPNVFKELFEAVKRTETMLFEEQCEPHPLLKLAMEPWRGSSAYSIGDSVGVNLDIGHFFLVTDRDEEFGNESWRRADVSDSEAPLSGRCSGGVPLSIAARVIHTHICDHAVAHYADRPAGTFHSLGEYLAVLNSIGGSDNAVPKTSVVSIELERVSDPSEVVRTFSMLDSLLRNRGAVPMAS